MRGGRRRCGGGPRRWSTSPRSLTRSGQVSTAASISDRSDNSLVSRQASAARLRRSGARPGRPGGVPRRARRVAPGPSAPRPPSSVILELDAALGAAAEARGGAWVGARGRPAHPCVVSAGPPRATHAPMSGAAAGRTTPPRCARREARPWRATGQCRLRSRGRESAGAARRALTGWPACRSPGRPADRPTAVDRPAVGHFPRKRSPTTQRLKVRASDSPEARGFPVSTCIDKVQSLKLWIQFSTRVNA